MRTEITEAAYREIYAGDLSEMFETFIQQHQYLEVLNCNGRDKTEFIGCLSSFEPGRFFNASCWFEPIMKPVSPEHPNGYTLTSTVASQNGGITETYFLYDTLDDAFAHVAELLAAMDRDHFV